ncbi:hypothetical protein AB3515_09575 [Acinetobacter baumannii]
MILPLAIHTLREKFPTIRIKILSGVYEYLVEKLNTQEIDLIIGRLIGKDMTGVILKLCTKRIYYWWLELTTRYY